MPDDTGIRAGWKVKPNPKPKKTTTSTKRAREQPHIASDDEEVEQYVGADTPTAILMGTKAPKHSEPTKHKWKRLRKDEDEDDIQALTHMKGNMKKDRTHIVMKDALGKQNDMKAKAATAKQGMGNMQRASTGSKFDAQIVEEYMSHIKEWEELKKTLVEIETDESIRFWPYPRFKMADYVIIKNGKRRAGKTTLTKNLFRGTYGMFPEEYLFSNTINTAQWREWYPKNAQFPGYSDGVIWELQTEQKEKVRRNIRAIDHWVEYEDDSMQHFVKNPYIRLLMDDCIDNNMHYSETIASIGYYGRHDAFQLDINTQFGHAVNTGLRGNCDVAFGFGQVQRNQRETFRDEYWGFAGTKGVFDKMYDELTANMHFVALHNADIAKSNRFEVIYHGSPDRHDTDPIMLGSSEFWQDLDQDKV